MNNLRKKSALATFGPLMATKSPADIKALVEQDERGYDAKEVDEIMEAVLNYSEEPAANDAGKSATPMPAQKGAKEEKTSLNKLYEEWAVESQYKNVPAQKGAAAYREHTGFVRVKKIRETKITPEKAQTLNEHSESTAIRLYLQEEITAGKDK